ncbi:MAG TPA: PilZ domain-containing protein [Arenimonas sp.]|nr:PilZ domain-containing protein [Arenimonas sp.]
MTVEQAPATDNSMDLKGLRLRPGMFMQLQSRAGKDSCEAQFCAAIGGRGIMVVPVDDAQPNGGLHPGETRRVKGFTGIYDYEFDADVIQHFSQPFTYTLLRYPSAVNARRVRSSLRIRTALPAYVRREGCDPVAGVIVDLSAAGAMVATSGEMGAIGESARLHFALVLEGKAYDLNLPASICHGAVNDNGEGYRTGFAFKELSRNDRLLLRHFALLSSEGVD